VCGNRLCEENEDACSCREDCGVCCQNGVCEAEAGESYANCPVDCSVSLVGAVVDAATNAPIVGAEITVVCRNGNDELPPPPITDNSAFEYLTREAGTYTCTAMADRYSPNSQTITLNANVLPSDPARPRPITIPLHRIHTGVYGTVSSATTGVRIANARVNCTALPAFGDVASTLREFTNVRGGFHFGQMVVADGAADWLCAVSAAGYEESAVQTVVLSQTASTKVEFTLTPRQTDLVVRVVDGATDIAVSTPTSVWCESKTFGAADLPATDVNPATGTVTYTAIAAGVYQCHASSDTYHGSCEPVHVDMGRVAEVDVVVKARGGHIRGVTCEDDCVIDPADGSCVNATRVARIEVTCTLDEPTNPHAGVTQFHIGSYSSEREDDVGQFTIGNLPAGEYVCVGRFPWKYEDSAPVRATVLPCEYTDIKLVMPPLLGQIVGLVYVPEQTGEIVPIDGASVVCTDGKLVQHPTTSFPIFYDPSLVSLSVDLVTGYQPNYVIDDANAGSISCTCSAEGFQDTTAVGVLVAGARVRIDCPMRPFLGTVRATLVDEQTEREVCFGAVTCDGVSRSYSEREPLSGQGPNPFLFGEDNEFELRVGLYECQGSSIPEYFPSRLGLVEVTGSGEFGVELLAAPQPATITGRVFDDGADDPTGVFFNRGVENAQVTCDVTRTLGHTDAPASTTHASAMTPPLGNYAIDDVMQFATWPLDPERCQPGPTETDGGQAVCVARAQGYLPNQQGDETYRSRATVVDFALRAELANITVRHRDQLTDLFVTTEGRTTCRRSADGWIQRIDCDGPCSTDSYFFTDKRSDVYTCECSAFGYTNAPPVVFNHSAPTNTVVDCLLGPLGHDIDIGVFDLRDQVPTPPFPGANTPLAGVDGAEVVCTFDDGSAARTLTVNDQGIASLSQFNFGATMTCTSTYSGFQGQEDPMTGTFSNVVEIVIQRDTTSQLPTWLGPIPATIFGTVTDSLNGAPLANVTLSFTTPLGTVVTRQTNDAGSYLYNIFDDFGDYTINTVENTPPPTYAVNSLSPGEVVAVEPENDYEHNYQLTPLSSTITATVRDAGVPNAPVIEGATVECGDIGGSGVAPTQGTQSGTTDSSGVLVFTYAGDDLSAANTAIYYHPAGVTTFSCTASFATNYDTETLEVSLERDQNAPLEFRIRRLSVQAEMRVLFAPPNTWTSAFAGISVEVYRMPEEGNPSACFGPACSSLNPFGTELIDSIPTPLGGNGPILTDADGLIRFRVEVPGNIGIRIPISDFPLIDAVSFSEGECPGSCFPSDGHSDPTDPVKPGTNNSYTLATAAAINAELTRTATDCEAASTAGTNLCTQPTLIPKNPVVSGCLEHASTNRIQDISEFDGADVTVEVVGSDTRTSSTTNATGCFSFEYANVGVDMRLFVTIDQYFTSEVFFFSENYGIEYNFPNITMVQNNEFTVTGKVIDSASQPIENADISVYLNPFTPPTDDTIPPTPEPGTTTNADGNYTLVNVFSNPNAGGTWICASATGFRSGAAADSARLLCTEADFPGDITGLDFLLIKEGAQIRIELIRYDGTGQRVFLPNRQARRFPAGTPEANKPDPLGLVTLNSVLFGGLDPGDWQIECFYQTSVRRQANATVCAGAGGKAGHGRSDPNEATCNHTTPTAGDQQGIENDSCIACGCSTTEVFSLVANARAFGVCTFCDLAGSGNEGQEGPCAFALSPAVHGSCTDVRDCPGGCHGCLPGVARFDDVTQNCASP
jgi:hypothetical protein